MKRICLMFIILFACLLTTSSVYANSPVFDEGSSTTRSIAENTVANTNIGDPVSATDSDSTRLTYTLVGGIGNVDHFRIVRRSGQLKTKGALNYETNNSYSIIIYVRDKDGNLDSISVTVNVTDVPETAPPVFSEGDTATRIVGENMDANTVVGKPLTATDADGEKLNYWIEASDTDGRAFKITRRSGQLKTRLTLDYEIQESYTFTVFVSDGVNEDTIEVTVQIHDFAEEGELYFAEGESTTRSVAQNAPIGTNVGAPVIATDIHDDITSYSLHSLLTIFPFSVTNTGQIQTAALLAADGPSVWDVTIWAKDKFGHIERINVAIHMGEYENTAPSFGNATTFTRSIVENSPPGTPIGAPISATDADLDTITYSLAGLDAAHFSIDTATGQLSTKGALNYETKTSYRVSVSVQDTENNTNTIDVIINIDDIVHDITPVRDRTPQVRNAIVSLLRNRATADDVTPNDLRKIYSLRLNSMRVASLKPDDFDGMSNISLLYLQDNRLVTLPDNIFSDQSNLMGLYLGDNNLTRLTSATFNGLTNLKYLQLYGNNITHLSNDVFSNTPKLERIFLNQNDISTLHQDTFSGLTSLKELFLHGNEITSLHENIFSDLSILESLYLQGNQLEVIHADLLSGLSNLKELHLNYNRLEALPAGIFTDKASLKRLSLDGNSVNPMPIKISLVMVGSGDPTIKLTVQEGAPFDINVLLSASNVYFHIDGSAFTSKVVTIPAGETESATISVRLDHISDTFSVTMGTLPSLPEYHRGYTLIKDNQFSLGDTP